MLSYEFIDPEQQISSEDFKDVESFLKLTGRTQLGWHYITDLCWIYSKVKQWPKGLKILDGGGGSGPTQFLLAEMGFHVINIDLSLSEPPSAYKQRYRTELEILPSFSPTSYSEFLSSLNSDSDSKFRFKKWIKSLPIYNWYNSIKYSDKYSDLSTNSEKWRDSVGLKEVSMGSISWKIGNLRQLPEIPSDFFDGVVSLSSLEHIPTDILDEALQEINRILKPNALWAVTTSGTEKSSTWFHEPSNGYCFSSFDFEKRFGAKPIENQDPSLILKRYSQCSYLKENLADFYKKSGRYGMPWGIWEPKYIPVGLSN
jgi:ubiquinone/menaquinone biosynthesis C-methylase UbiE